MTPKILRTLLDGLPGCQVTGDLDAQVTGVAYHSREVVPGGLFVALKGCRTDGHLYVEASLNQGARVIVTEEELTPPPGVTVVRVPKARLALAHLSAAFYDHPSRELTLVGITGTNGKTSTTYLLEAILNAAGHRVGVVGTVNYRVGEATWPAPVTTPESLDLQRLLREMRTHDVSHVFLEVSSHALDLRRVDCAAFDCRGLHQPLPGPPGLPPGPGRLFCCQVPPVPGNFGQRRRLPGLGGPQSGRSPGP